MGTLTRVTEKSLDADLAGRLQRQWDADLAGLAPTPWLRQKQAASALVVKKKVSVWVSAQRRAARHWLLHRATQAEESVPHQPAGTWSVTQAYAANCIIQRNGNASRALLPAVRPGQLLIGARLINQPGCLEQVLFVLRVDAPRTKRAGGRCLFPAST